MIGGIRASILVLSGISIICALTMMLLIKILQRKQPSIAHTVSFRLSFYIALADLLYRLPIFYYRIYEFIGAWHPKWMVAIVVFLARFCPLLVVFLTDAIALDLHMTFVRDRYSTVALQSFYVPVSFGLSLLLSGHIFFAQNHGYDVEDYNFVITWGSKTTDQIILLCTFVLPLLLGISYCAAVVIMVLNRIRKQVARIEERDVEATSYDSRADYQRMQSDLQRAALRISLYPVVPLVVFTPCAVQWFVERWIYNSAVQYVYLAIVDILLSTVGIFNLAVFLLNPALTRAFSAIKHEREMNKKFKLAAEVAATEVVVVDKMDNQGMNAVSSADDEGTAATTSPVSPVSPQFTRNNVSSDSANSITPLTTTNIQNQTNHPTGVIAGIRRLFAHTNQ
ncbi:hypothetical protein GQ42DRAFT_160301 [Ramicandelaber brevisporus]|nr:hypothetical protein GQ42DRAFT_164540 [Ramicandelaber brevisporus]KAI8873756.1 hypothetical protein GQ42DRAFT_160301 [Ramicandelaber brevisporus]